MSDLVERANVTASDLVERANVTASELVERANVTGWFTIAWMVNK